MLYGCAQQPAPVVNGYQNGNKILGVSAKNSPENSQNQGFSLTREVAAAPAETAPVSLKEEELQSISPAAGPADSGQGAPKTAAATRSLVADWTEKPVQSQGVVTHTVQPGETVYRLARRYNTTPAEILKQNQMNSTSQLAAGQQLAIPSGSKVAAQNPQKTWVQSGPQTAQVDANRVQSGPQLASNSPQKAQPGPQPTLQPAKAEVLPPRLLTETEADAIEPAAGPQKQEEKLAPVVSGKADVKTVTHKVKPGETVYRIAHQYGASVLDVMSANQFNQPQDLKAGTVVKVPVHEIAEPADKGVAKEEDETAESKPVPPKTAVDEVKAAFNKGKIDPVAARAKGMAWPVNGQVIRRFGSQGGGVANAGINISVPPNTPVLAAETGTVMYAGNGLKTYGNLVLIKHPDGLVGAYAHNNQLLVSKGDLVKKGQVIALSGATGNVDKPQVHFELRRNARAVDPTTLLAAQ